MQMVLFRNAGEEALMKSKYADLRQKLPLARKKTTGILADFKVF